MVYNFDINNRAFKGIKDGRKKCEIRVTKVNDDFDYSVISSGDYIKFTSYDNEKMICKVLKVNWYESAEELLTMEGTKYTLSSTDDFDEGIRSLNSFDGSTEGIKKNGIYAIHIEVVDEIIKKVELSDLSCIDDISIDKYILYRDKIKDDMEYPEWLGDFSKEDLKTLLNNGSRIWMYYHDDNFVSSMMVIPADEDALKKFGVELDYRDVVDYGPIMVSSKYRGNNLQYQMTVELDNYSKDLGYRYAISTIHPDNIYSIATLEKAGFELIGQREFKRGLRNIYLKRLDD